MDVVHSMTGLHHWVRSLATNPAKVSLTGYQIICDQMINIELISLAAKVRQSSIRGGSMFSSRKKLFVNQICVNFYSSETYNGSPYRPIPVCLNFDFRGKRNYLRRIK